MPYIYEKGPGKPDFRRPQHWSWAKRAIDVGPEEDAEIVQPIITPEPKLLPAHKET